jgi:acyl-CoA thioesterase
MTMTQGSEVTTTATAFFALRRETWASTETGFPQVPAADSLPRMDSSAFAQWTKCYDMRFVKGFWPDGSTPEQELDSVSTLWIRDDPPRPMDFVSLAAICDSFFPRVMIRRPRRVPAGTVSLTTYFHADAKHLARVGEKHVLATARASRFGLGYHDQSAEIWSEGGELLATSHQVVYFKE